MLSSIIKLAQQLIDKPSITPNDVGCQLILIERLKKIGFNIQKINSANVSNFFAWRGKGKKTLAFSGHTDVVPSGNIKLWHYPPFKGSLHNNMLYGRGAADMKGALAAMIIATERFVDQFPDHQGRIFFIITSDEEGKAKNGTIKIIKYLMNHKEQINYCIIGEPSSYRKLGDVIKNGRRGSLTGLLIIHGIQGHVAYPHLANNPIHSTIPIINILLSKIWDTGNDTFPPTTLQIVNIRAGTKKNSNLIPAILQMQLNFRFNNISTENQLCKQVENLIKEHGLSYNIKWFLHAKPYISYTGTLTNTVITTIKHYQKITPKIETSGGSSDGRFISYMKSEIIELGLINKTIHKINECTNINDLYSLSLIYKKILESLII
ncbi:succinyl-diaminopimelate desuccinylase [Blochmannia endosymbiont of Camponotus (Colobopsis) obliquus]|uniref:succinyl-diaminopimelate desuccinylase n=1 Tax=Blochmannia endosymbiont of Camponotus (Colobopsis) obliquus TaxID=1505597 RepID=UPI00061A72DA|nr:succinyl-diaminopimelate desuccinylase [Blochmannia endosymbiont of Camponotus (Colobopsis) obliquus]AKC60664.1 succinyl-diaminopimelate desuccinylase [Blochmannia endosymbiont of Camponotus (Colobopsis) obliquus]